MLTAQAGWAEVDITPPLGVPLGGRGPRAAHVREILDPLLAQAVALSDPAGQKLLIVSMDLIGLSGATAEPIRHEIAAATGVPLDGVLLNFSHTHAGPMVNADRYVPILRRSRLLEEYLADLQTRLVGVARRACDNLAPADVTWHRGRSNIAINRRLRTPEGAIEMRPNPDGTHHPDLWALDITTNSGGRAVVFCHACHPVIVYGFAYRSISADFPGRARRRLGELLGQSVHCQFLQGMAGNVRPRVLADLGQQRFRVSTPDDLAAAGDELADDVCTTLSSRGDKLELDLSAAMTWVTLATGEPPPADHFREWEKSDERLRRRIARYWLDRYENGPPLARGVPWPVGLVRLDAGHRIAWMAGEVFAEWRDLLCGWLGDGELMTCGYSQQVVAYLPTDAQLDEGGYEVTTAPAFGPTGPASFAAGLDRTIEQAFIRLAACTK